MIETERLILRPWREDDKPRFAEIINTPAMMRFYGGVSARDVLDGMIDRHIAGQQKFGFSTWAVETRHNRTLAGACGLQIAPHYAGTPVEGMLEIGWRIAEPLWGKGIAREAAEASIAWGWAHTNAPEIASWTHRDNDRSWGLMERLGMTRRPAIDFHHPRYAADDSAGGMIVYTLDRPA